MRERINSAVLAMIDWVSGRCGGTHAEQQVDAVRDGDRDGVLQRVLAGSSSPGGRQSQQRDR